MQRQGGLIRVLTIPQAFHRHVVSALQHVCHYVWR